MTQEERIQKKIYLLDWIDYQTEMYSKYGQRSIYDSIVATHKELEQYQDLGIVRDGDFAKFARGDSGFI